MRGHALERFPIDAFFIDAQPAPARLIAEHLMGKLVDAGTGFARAGVAGNKPATAKLIPFPAQSFQHGDSMGWLFGDKQREKSNCQKRCDNYPAKLYWQPMVSRASGNQVCGEKEDSEEIHDSK